MVGVAVGEGTAVGDAGTAVAARVGARVGAPVAVDAGVATGMAVGVPVGAGATVGVDAQPLRRSAARVIQDLIAFIIWSRNNTVAATSVRRPTLIHRPFAEHLMRQCPAAAPGLPHPTPKNDGRDHTPRASHGECDLAVCF